MKPTRSNRITKKAVEEQLKQREHHEEEKEIVDNYSDEEESKLSSTKKNIKKTGKSLLTQSKNPDNYDSEEERLNKENSEPNVTEKVSKRKLGKKIELLPSLDNDEEKRNTRQKSKSSQITMASPTIVKLRTRGKKWNII